MKTEREESQREQLREDLLAVLAASRELTADHDDSLADLILERVELPRTVVKPGPVAPQRRRARAAGPVPILVAAAIATILSLVPALLSGSSLVDFLGLWFFVVCAVCGVVQIGLYLGVARVPGRPLHKL